MNYKFSDLIIDLNNKIINGTIDKEDYPTINYHIIIMNLNIKYDLKIDFYKSLVIIDFIDNLINKKEQL